MGLLIEKNHISTKGITLCAMLDRVLHVLLETYTDFGVVAMQALLVHVQLLEVRQVCNDPSYLRRSQRVALDCGSGGLRARLNSRSECLITG